MFLYDGNVHDNGDDGCNDKLFKMYIYWAFFMIMSQIELTFKNCLVKACLLCYHIISCC